MQVLVDFHFLIISNRQCLIALYFEKFIIRRDSCEIFNLAPSEFVLSRSEWLVVHVNCELRPFSFVTC